MLFFKALRRNQKGATAIEYGLIAALVAIAGVSTMGPLGTKIKNTFQAADDKMVVAQ